MQFDLDKSFRQEHEARACKHCTSLQLFAWFWYLRNLSLNEFLNSKTFLYDVMLLHEFFYKMSNLSDIDKMFSWFLVLIEDKNTNIGNFTAQNDKHKNL